MTYRSFECPILKVSDASGRRWEGIGTISVTILGKIQLTVEYGPDVPPSISSGGFYRVEGTTRDGEAVHGDACLVDGSEWNSTIGKVVLRLTAGKPIFITDRSTKARCQATRKLHLKNLHVLGTEQWTWDGVPYELKRLRKQGDDKPDGAINAELVIEDGKPNPHVGREGLLDLLSLAARCPCEAPVEEVFVEGKVVETRLQTSYSDCKPTHPLIPADCLGGFMAAALPGFVKHAENAGLHVLTAYYCRSHTESMAEFKFLFASVLMEALKFNWGLSKMKLSTKIGGSGIVQRFVKTDGKPYSFKELMDVVAADLGVQANYTFIENRNAIFHTGEAVAAQRGHANVWPFLSAELQKLHDQIDDLLLTLLGYAGTIQPAWDVNVPVVFPVRTPLS